MSIVYTFNNSGSMFGVVGDVSLKFSKPDVLEGQTGYVRAGQMTTLDSRIGHSVSSGDAVLSIQFASSLIPEDEIEMMARYAVKALTTQSDKGESVADNALVETMGAMAIAWVSQKARSIGQRYFENPNDVDPLISVSFDQTPRKIDRDSFYSLYHTVKTAEAIMSAIPNDHPHWRGVGL